MPRIGDVRHRRPTLWVPSLARLDGVLNPTSSWRARAIRIATAFGVWMASLAGFETPVLGHSRGIQASGCEGCHGSGLQATLVLSADRPSIELGDTVTLTATISRLGMKVGGMFVASPTLGTLGTTSGDGLTLSAGALTQSSPKAATSDSVNFAFTWRAPLEPGAVEFHIYALAANGDGTSTGDAPTEGVFPYTFGCTPQTFYFDADGDGYGATDFASTLGCADQPPPAGYAPSADDCDDGHDQVHPGAIERCNGKDDDCDGVIDDGANAEELFPDPDGDGFYGVTPGASVIGCLPLAGYANQPGDCAADDPTRYPGAEEICNLFDDDCDGRVDEYVRPRCGVGWCEREGPSCDAADCVPGTPRAERCNLLDDDCNGEVDDGDLCGAGQACLGGVCTALGAGSPVTAATGGAAAGAASATPGSAGAVAMGNGTGAVGISSSGAATGGSGGSSANSTGCAVANRGFDPTLFWMLSVGLVVFACRRTSSHRR